ncbi:MAG: hypothetical protein ACPL88_12575, partial [Bryobacteraceae bacterium]
MHGADQKLLEDCRVAWQDLNRIFDSLASEDPAGTRPTEEKARRLLIEALGEWRAARPLDRICAAMEAWRRCRLSLTPAESELGGGISRSLVADLLRRLELARGANFGSLVTLTARASAELLAPWQLARRESLRSWSRGAAARNLRRAH